MNTETEQVKFDHWCIVELMGHQTIAGRVTEINLFGAAMMRVDVPEQEGRAAFCKFYGASAIYAVTPVEEKIARAVALANDPRPVSEWQLRRMLPEPEPVTRNELAVMRQTLHDVQKLAVAAQGEWITPDDSPKPDEPGWVPTFRRIAAVIEDVLSQEEFGDDEELDF